MLAAVPGWAQRTIFSPSITLDGVYTDNVQYVGMTEGGPGCEAGPPCPGESDASARLGLTLALRREGAKVATGVRYVGFLERYKEFTFLDHDEHSAAVELGSLPGGRSSFGFTASYSMGQIQGNPAGSHSVDLYLSERTERRAYGSALRYDRQVSGLWSLGTTGWFSEARFEAVPGESEGSSAAAVEDRVEYGAALSVHREMSARGGIGWEYSFTRFDLEQSGREDVHTVVTRFDRRLGPNGSFSATVGAFERREAQDSADTAEAGGSNVELRVGIGLGRTGKRVTMSVNADRLASPGGALLGTSTDTMLGFTMANRNPVRWSWSVASRYGLREPNLPDQQDVRTISAGATLERGWHDETALRFSVTAVRQLSGEHRLQELAQMLGGISNGTLQSAREILALAEDQTKS